MKGKEKCRILRDIRKEIAERNNIEYVTSECRFSGECKGTCPKCEAELEYLEKELEKRKRFGKKIAVAGIAAASVVSIGTFSACSIHNRNTIAGNELEGDLDIGYVKVVSESVRDKDYGLAEQTNEEDESEKVKFDGMLVGDIAIEE